MTEISIRGTRNWSFSLIWLWLIVLNHLMIWISIGDSWHWSCISHLVINDCFEPHNDCNNNKFQQTPPSSSDQNITIFRHDKTDKFVQLALNNNHIFTQNMKKKLYYSTTNLQPLLVTLTKFWLPTIANKKCNCIQSGISNLNLDNIPCSDNKLHRYLRNNHICKDRIYLNKFLSW